MPVALHSQSSSAAILVIADTTATSVLRQAGHRVVTASTGAEAVVLVRSEHPGLILLGDDPTDISAGEFLRDIRTDTALNNIPIVTLGPGGHPPAGIAPDDHITLPVTDTELLARVRLHLRQHELATQLRVAAERYRLLFENNPQPMWVYDLETLRFLAVNQAAVTQYGYTREEFRAMTIKDIRPPEDMPALMQTLSASSAGLNPDQPVARHRLKNGDIRIVQIVFNPITFDERRAHLVLARDITRRQQAEQELLRSNQDYQAQHDALLELTRHAANPDNDERASLGAITEKVAAILRAGRVSIWRFNLDRSAIVCADLFVGPDAVHADGIELREADFPGYFRALATGDVIDADDARADPRTREFTDTYLDPLGITSMLDAPILVAGELAGVLCVEHIGPARRWTTPERTFTVSVANLLSLTLAQQARTRSETRLRTILESEPECVKVVSLDGHLLDMNPAGLRMIEADDLRRVLGRPVITLIHPDDRAAFEALHQSTARGQGGRLTFRLAGLKGGQRWGETHSTPLREKHGRIDSVLSVTRDVTDHVLAEAELRQKTNILRIAGRITRTGGWLLELPGPRLYWSDEIFDMLGFPRGVTPSLDEALRLYPEPWRQRITAAIENCISDGTPIDTELQIDTRHGTRLWVRACAEAEHDDRGEIIRVQGAFQDITAQKEAANALLDSRRRFEELAENIGDVFFSHDTVNHRLLYINSAYEEVFGRSQLSIQADPLSYLQDAHPDDRQAAEDAYQRQLAGHRTVVEFRIIRPDGALRWIRETAVPILDSAGSVERIVGIMSDITGHKLAAERIAEQADLLDAAHEAILVKDLDDRIIYWNKGAERTYGWTSAEAVGQRTPELFNHASAPFAAAREQLLADGSWSGEFTHRAKDGRELTVETRWTLVLDPDGRPKSVLSINTDITERKKLEARFLRSQRMESIGTLAGGIAHDFNNLLAPISMGVELLRNSLDDPKHQLLLSTIERSAQRGASLVRQMLSFARGADGTPVPLQAQHILREVASIIANTFPKNITLETRLASDLWLVTADPTQINQIALNLCVNARDAMPDGGRLILAARNIRIDDTLAAGMHAGCPAGDYVQIEVSDTGEGIPPDLQERIFEPFFTTKEVGKGTGLGLSTVQGIVRGYGGFVTLDSERGKGSSFKIHLPASDEADHELPPLPETAAPPRGAGELILVVDDEAPILNVCRQTLEAFGYRVLTAGDGAEAIAAYAPLSHDIALVLTDMMMPVMDGLTLIAAIRRINPRVPVIAVSGLNTEDHIAKAARIGVTHFLPKPYTAEAVLTLVKHALRGTTA